MLKARLTDGTFIFGLERENVNRLVAGKPMVVNLAEVGGEGRVLITFGETTEDIKAELIKAFGPFNEEKSDEK